MGVLTACAPRRVPVATAAPVRAPADSVARRPAGTVGVPPFALSDTAPNGRLSPLAYALADILTTDLARSRRISVVERARLGEVLRELDLAKSGSVDSATAPRVGRLLQAERLVMGRVTALPTGSTIRLGVQLADVAQGTLEQAVDATAPLDQVLAAEKQLAFRLFDALGVTLTPDEQAAVAQRPTENLEALLAYGRGVRYQYLGEYRRAESEFRRAMRVDPGFTGARERVTEVRRVSQASAVTEPVLVPGVKATAAAVSSTVDQLNRPLDMITTVTSATTSRTTDPTFPTSTATVVITVTRP